jgi:hypothetical protein
MVKVTKAYRDSSGTLHSGSMIDILCCDDVNRRLEKPNIRPDQEEYHSTSWKTFLTLMALNLASAIFVSPVNL